ncbi:MAG: FAD-dependent oxidoreductase [Ardenticatenaceae bacterium]|nr:FAD-dependent oxidoreductase [Ardenticatenaceae bacterium]
MPLLLGETFSFDQTVPVRRPGTAVAGEARTTIAIIGAGLAGLVCAYRLADGGRRRLDRSQVVVLEREAQPGGRIRSLQVGDTVLNLGAVTFQPEHYQRYRALLTELGLTNGVRVIPRRRMIFGYQARATRTDTVSLLWDTVKGLLGRGLFSPAESWQLLCFYLFLRRIAAPEAEAERMALHEISVAQWALKSGFSASLQRKFVDPSTRYCFRAPEEVSAAFGIFLLGFNLSHPATLVGGFGQVADALARPLGGVLELEATALEVAREPGGFAIVYVKNGRLHRLHARSLVVAVPANVAAQLVPEMRARASTVAYGAGAGTVVSGTLKEEAQAQLHLRVSVGPNGTVIYGGEIQARPGGGHYANVLTYRGDDPLPEASKLFLQQRVERLTHYRIHPAAAAPKPGQKPLPMEWGDGLYLAGDCVGLFPSQETAVSTGEEVARLLRGEAVR